MTVYEMEGFLRGKCIPGDLKVNETNAEYLVRKFGELENKCAALAVENAKLKAGHSYFSYGSEHNFEWHKTAEEAIESAEAAIDDYRGDACDGWSEEVDSICWGIIMQSSTKVGERPRNEDDCCDPAIDTICDYALLPNIDTPATDAFLAEVRASELDSLAGVAETMLVKFSNQSCSSDMHEVVGWKMVLQQANNRAIQLRKG